ncbi:MAG: hypothetical protein ACRELA_22385 [Candidatus Rokuibacteriota bacterium]
MTRPTIGLLLGLVTVLGGVASGETAPIAVRFTEGLVHGFLVLKSPQGDRLADGELLQVPHRGHVESRLVFRFADGSLHDETVAFTQRDVFTLLTYRLIQRGPSFSDATEVSMERETGQYTVRSRKSGAGAEEVHTGRIELPPDVYNAMFSTILKNVPRGEGATVHLVAFTPKARMLKVQIIPAGENPVLVGDAERRATRYLLKPQLGGLLGVVAPLIGKEPPDLRYWILGGPVPAFLRFEGPFSASGPVWQVELTSPRWPSDGRDGTRREGSSSGAPRP